MPTKINLLINLTLYFLVNLSLSTCNKIVLHYVSLQPVFCRSGLCFFTPSKTANDDGDEDDNEERDDYDDKETN